MNATFIWIKPFFDRITPCVHILYYLSLRLQTVLGLIRLAVKCYLISIIFTGAALSFIYFPW